MGDSEISWVTHFQFVVLGTMPVMRALGDDAAEAYGLSARVFGGSGLGAALQFHFAKSQRQAETNVSAGPLIVRRAAVVGVELCGIPAVPVEYIVAVQIE